MKNITKKAKVDINWKVSPYDYSKSKINDIVEKASKKYNISKEQIKVKPDFIMVDSGGKKISIEKDIIENIQDPSFQQKLFKEFIETNKIDGCDFNSIKDIDNEINSEINYKEYSKYKRLSIKWIKWDNFLSYGPDNIFNFDNLQNLVLLNGEPANQSGKTTFAVDLIHFLLFGKTSKAETLDKIFNKHLKEATNVNVEGCIVIDNEEYIINRILTRPSASKRTEKSKVSQKVEYFKVIGGIKEELTDYDIDNQQGESTQTTNKIIKDAIGKESDFNLMMSITESTLDAMIDEKPTERGKLLSRWIGLLPLEEKEILA